MKEKRRRNPGSGRKRLLVLLLLAAIVLSGIPETGLSWQNPGAEAAEETQESEQESEKESGGEAQTETVRIPETESGTGGAAQTETAEATETERETGTAGETQTETQSGTESESMPETEQESKPETEPDSMPGNESEPLWETETESISGTEPESAPGTETNPASETQTQPDKETESGTKQETETENPQEEVPLLPEEGWRDGPIRRVGGISLFTARYPTVSRDSSEILSYLGFPCYFKYVTNHGMSVGGKTVAAYCLYNTREAPEDERYTYDGEGSLSKEITYCLYSGCRYRGSTAYNSRYSAGNWKKDYYITQMAIHIINHQQGRESSIEGDLRRSEDPEVYRLVYRLVEDAYADTEIASSVTNQTKEVSFEITPSSQDSWSKQGDGTYRTRESFTCSSNKPDRILEVSRTLAKGTPSGVTIVAEEPDNPLSPFYFQATQAAYQKIARDKLTVTAQVTVTAEEYGGWWYEPADSSVRRQAVTYLSLDYTELEEKREASATASELFFRIKLRKKEAGTGLPLGGAVYGLYAEEACRTLLYTFPATDGQGETQLGDLSAGQEVYYVKEITAPPGHVLNPEVYPVDVSREETVITAEDKAQTASLTIWKEGEALVGAVPQGEGIQFRYENRRMGGAVYTLYAEERIQNAAGQTVYSPGEIVREQIRSDADGKAVVTGLPFGKYALEETQAPPGMAKSKERYSLELKAPGQTEEVSVHTVTVQNDRIKARVRIYKTDAETGNPLAGAKFGLYAGEKITTVSGEQAAEAGRLLAVGVTGKDGWLTFEADLPAGFSYYAQELQAPQGYVRNEDARFAWKVSETGEAVQEFSYSCTNQSCRVSVQLEKTDAETGQALPQGDASLEGAVYGLFAREDIVHPDGKTGILYHEGEQAAVLTTDGEGKAEAGELYPGKYYLKELKAPVGYVQDETEYEVDGSWKEDKTLVIEKQVSVKDQVKKQPFQLIKVSQEGEEDAPLLKGAGFTAYLVSALEKDEKGEYLLDEAKPVVIGENGETELFTDENGHLQTIPLPYGTYLVRETTVPEEFKPVKDFCVTISEHSPQEPKPWRILLDERFRGKIKVVKKDRETGEILKIPGASFQILNQETGEFVKQTVTYPKRETLDTFVTNEEGYLILPEALLPGKYSLLETEAPEGYLRNPEPLEFEISSGCAYETDSLTGDVLFVLEYRNAPVKGEIRVKKTGELASREEGKLVYRDTPLEGVIFDVYAKEEILYGDGRIDSEGKRKILYPKGTLVGSAATDEKGELRVENLPLGTYEVRERKPPETFLESGEQVIAELSYQDAKTPVVFWEKDWINVRQKVEVKVEKKDRESKAPIEGAKFSLYAAQEIRALDGSLLFEKGELVSSCVTDKEGKGIFEEDLPHGRYEIREEQAAPGYVSCREILEADLSYRDGRTEKAAFLGSFENVRTSFAITKAELTGDGEIEGAHLEVKDEDGTVIDQWISGKEPHRIRGLEVGKTYFLTETLPAPGYVTAETIAFVPKDTEEVQRVTMLDDVTRVMVSKQDRTDGSEILGAKLSILDEEGKTVRTWVQDGEPYLVEKLPQGSYLLREEAAPYGYLLAEDVPFTVEDTGEIQKVEMQDARPAGRLLLKKTDQETGEGLEGAVFELRNHEGELLETLVTDENGEAESGLLEIATYEEGRCLGELTYFLKETRAPEGYEKEEEEQEIQFAYTDGGIQEIQKEVEVKNRRLPQAQETAPGTGDHTGTELWLGLMAAAAFAGAALLWSRKSRRQPRA